MTTNQPQNRPARKTLRLTFRVSDGEARLVKYERLNMITPPSVGEAPQVGTHGGFWVELRDPSDRVLFHRVLHLPLQDSVEVHSPDGKIQRIMGEPAESTFEVLVPDYDDASTLALIGEYLDPKERIARHAERLRQVMEGELVSVEGARELARFELPKGGETKGGAQ